MKISVVTVVFNDVANIRKTIESVLNQDYSNLEYVIIDGGSVDGTLSVIEDYKNELDYFVSEKDDGIYNAMNKSSNYVTGDYIIFMNTGDEFQDKDVLSKVFNEEKSSNFDVIYGTTIVVNGTSKNIVKPKSLKDITKGRMIFVHQSSFLRVNLLREFKFDESYKINSDYDLFLKLFINGYSFQRTDVIISLYQSGGISSKVGFQNEIEKIKILKANKVATFNNLLRVILIGVKRFFKKIMKK